ncbi:ubiC Transcriptional regulator, GntR family [Lactobacillus selangorensis]|uniref:UbiC Transcriptional regulator, GntR family n=1 Tax=Lactobacillus selangorensis TaxID=81857 RepID=A0A0R2FWC9_9LACO|nr:GntR family transcriptional regulator [Lactobacillus selangorensis]KRN28980.1 ubiC Transcriptional regulator, GntR family [Lactobacillus selangorensis]KRN32610.1 ubiC Transcriptional regulator, GntR family [Lactobacillus selangorensis]
MTLIYQEIATDLRKRIDHDEFQNMKLPDERTLSTKYQVSRSSIKRALNELADKGIIFKKRGSGTFINPLYLKNATIFSYTGSNLGVTDSFQQNGEHPDIKVLRFEVTRPSADLQQDLFLKPDDFVYEIIRLRALKQQPFMIEKSYIPIKIMPELSEDIVAHSIFNYMEKERQQRVTKAFLSLYAAPSNEHDQAELKLKPTEPVEVMEGIFFLADGTPFEFSKMHLHYQYLKYNTFVALDD